MKVRIKNSSLVNIFLLIVIGFLIQNQYSFRIIRLFKPNKIDIGAFTVEVPNNWFVKKYGNSLWVFSTQDGGLLFYAIIGKGKLVPARIDAWKTMVESHNGYMIPFKIQKFSAYESSSVYPNSSEPTIVFRIQKKGLSIMVRYYGRVSDKYKVLKELIHSIRENSVKIRGQGNNERENRG